MMKRNHKSRMAIALAFALTLSLSSPMLTGLQTFAAQGPINEELTTPFGLVADYNAEQGIGVVWGAAGYELYTVTISCEANGYEKVYTDQNLGYHLYPDDYAGGDYLIEIQGQKDGKLSQAATATITIAGGAASGGSGQEESGEGGGAGTGGEGSGTGSGNEGEGGGTGTGGEDEGGESGTDNPGEGGVGEGNTEEDLSGIDFGTLDHSKDYVDGGTDVTIKYDGVKAIVTGTDWGNDWGADSRWQVQLMEVIDTPENDKYNVSFKVKSDVARDIFVKLGNINDNATVFAEQTVSVAAGETEVSITSVKPVDIDKMLIDFALGTNGGSTENTIVISNLKVTLAKDEETPPVVTPEEDLSGIDFETLDHTADYIDEGTDVTVKYEGVKATITGTDWGNDWGNDSHWQIQLKEVVETPLNQKYDVSFKVKSDVAREMFLKLGDLHNDGTVYAEQTINLSAGETKVNITTDKEVDIDDMMVLFALGTKGGSEANTIVISNLKVQPHREAGVKEGAISFEDAQTELYVGSDWAGVNAEVKETGTKAELNAASYGWNGEWGLQYMVKSLGLKEGETYTLSVDMTSSIDKKAMIKLDDSGAIVDTIDLKSGELYEYSKEVTVDQVANDTLYFALGQMQGETANLSGKLTIENLRIQDSHGNYLALTGGSAQGEKGPEYDWKNKNSEFDYADPGRSKDGYQLIWSDEFDGNYGSANVDANGLNLDNWAYQLGDGTTDCGNYGWGNNELQCYTDKATNVGVNEDLDGDGQGEGVLRISAVNEPGYKYANESAKNYTSARLRTTKPNGELFNTTYGYVEARISLPQTPGAWPAFWMLPQSTDIYGGWPVSGEIDILETTGTQTNQACSTLHWGVPAHVYKGSGYTALDSEISYFHTYAVDWEPGKMTFYYDGKEIYSSSNWASAIPGASDSLGFDAPFDMPFYMILNLAVDSGQFGGGANKAAFKDDINMYVDYVRVFQRNEGYADSVAKSADSSAAVDWTEYKGINQIAEITDATLDVTGGGHDDNAAKGSGKWYLSNQNDASATASVVTDNKGTQWAKVDVIKQGSQDYGVQLIGHYDAKKGYVYRVTYDTYAEGGLVGKQVNCDSKEYAGWSTYGIQSFSLGSEPETRSFMFQQSEDFDNCRIEFNIGGMGTGTVYISNVKVEIVDPELMGATDPSGAHGVLADGNMIFNGTFDQGNGHTGYWLPAAGTTLSVPRYTTRALQSSDVKVKDIASMTNYENIPDGIKYYERRGEVSANGGSPVIYQPGIKMTADKYTLSFDMFSDTDSAVKASVYTTNTVGETVSLGREVTSAKASYNANDGVRRYSLTFETTEDIANAAVVLTFAKGTSVQIDNVKMTGENQASGVDENPVDDSTTWTGDSGAGASVEVTTGADGSKTMSGIASGGSWYSPQLGSSNFSIVAGLKYSLSLKYKMTGTNNGTFEYIVQENGGSWAVAQDVVKVDSNGLTPDADGFYTYETEFESKASMDDCHLNFGFGNSAATGDMTFTFKDISLDLVKEASSGTGSDNDDNVDDDNFDAPVISGGDNEEPGSGNGGSTGGNGGSTGGNGGSTGGNGGSGSSGSGNAGSGNSGSGNAGSGSTGGSGSSNHGSGSSNQGTNGNQAAAGQNSQVLGAGRATGTALASTAGTTKSSGRTSTKNSTATTTTTESDTDNNEAETEAAETEAPATDEPAEVVIDNEQTETQEAPAQTEEIADAETPLAETPAQQGSNALIVAILAALAAAVVAAGGFVYYRLFSKK
ncbi:MAG: glycoside hydrolase family 16 protein [Butyrivibrio sp.]|nr:glycoside hydrolase family 16 protein [Butyrivibrio sp.]